MTKLSEEQVEQITEEWFETIDDACGPDVMSIEEAIETYELFRDVISSHLNMRIEASKADLAR